MSKPAEAEQTIEWTKHDFYFGLGKSECYRTTADRIQELKILGLIINQSEDSKNQYHGFSPEVVDFIANHIDCEFVVADSYELTSGDRQASGLWLQGWEELVPEDHHIFESAKKHSM